MRLNIKEIILCLPHYQRNTGGTFFPKVTPGKSRQGIMPELPFHRTKEVSELKTELRSKFHQKDS